MYILHRSILRELLVSFCISVVFLNFTLMMEKLLRLSRVFAGVGASLLDVGQIILYLQPQIMILTIPMGLLLSVLLTYGRLNADNELVIMRTAGMPFRTIARPVLYLGLGCFAASMLMSFYLGPLGSVMLREKISHILLTRAPLAIEEGVFNTSFRDMVLMVREKPRPDQLKGIFIMDERKKDEPKVIVAAEGRITSDADGLSVALFGGNAYLTSGNSLTVIGFGKYLFTLTPSIEPMGRKGSEFSPLELIREANNVPERRIPLLLEFHRRFSMPAVCLILMLLGPALSLMAGKAGRLGGLTIGLIVFVVYYSLLIYGENLTRSGTLPHLAGAWLSFAILGSFSLFVFERVNRT
jgi:lipopolysaccharide export system permease protein